LAIAVRKSRHADSKDNLMLFHQKRAPPTAKLSGGALRKETAAAAVKSWKITLAKVGKEGRQKTRAYFSRYLLITRNLMKSRAFLLLKFTEEASKERQHYVCKREFDMHTHTHRGTSLSPLVVYYFHHKHRRVSH
jgi:hypothetical protein